MLSSPLHHPSGIPPSPASRGRKKVAFSRHLMSEFCSTTTPFQNSLPERERSAERRMPTMSALGKQVYAVCATHLLRGCALLPKRRARLSALTLAALATGYYPDGSAPEPGFPKTDFASVLPAWPACLRLSTHRADRSFCRSTGAPEPPGSGLHHSARGHRPLLRPSKVPSRKAPSLSRMSIRNIIGDECQR